MKDRGKIRTQRPPFIQYSMSSAVNPGPTRGYSGRVMISDEPGEPVIKPLRNHSAVAAWRAARRIGSGSASAFVHDRSRRSKGQAGVGSSEGRGGGGGTCRGLM